MAAFGTAQGSRQEIRRRAEVLQGLDRQAEGGRLDRPDQFGHRPAHGLDHRRPLRACRCSRSVPAPASSPARSSAAASGRKISTRSSIRTISSRHLRRNYPGVNVIEGDAFDLDATLGDRRDMVFDSVVSGVPLLNFPVAERVAYLNGLLDRIPHGRPGRAADLRAEIAGAARPGRLHGRAFRFHHPQHPADAAVDLPARHAELSFGQALSRAVCRRLLIRRHLTCSGASPIPGGQERVPCHSEDTRLRRLDPHRRLQRSGPPTRR